MGLIRGALSLASGGAVAARSKKQRVAAQQLAAMQGASSAEIKIAGNRNFNLVNQDKIRRLREKELRERGTQQLPPDNTISWDSSSGITAELERLAALHASGVLDDDEFQAAKARIIRS